MSLLSAVLNILTEIWIEEKCVIINRNEFVQIHFLTQYLVMYTIYCTISSYIQLRVWVVSVHTLPYMCMCLRNRKRERDIGKGKIEDIIVGKGKKM